MRVTVRLKAGASAVWSFAPTPVLSSYVTAVVAGPYHRESGELTSTDGRTIPLVGDPVCASMHGDQLLADHQPDGGDPG